MKAFAARLFGTYKGWPLWARIAAPVTLGFLGIGVLSGGDDSKTEERSPGVVETTSTTAAPTTSTTAKPTRTTAPSTTTTTAPATTTTGPPTTTTTVKPTTTTAKPATTTVPPTTATTGVYYANCTEAKAAGVAPLYRGQPGYRDALDRDGDGVACET